jgi:4-amino-4-deoxy-L-arabinose transferase-like glycosyltransferase
LLAVALLVRVVALVAAADARPVLDEQLYLQRAVGLLEGQGFLGSWQSWVRHPDGTMMAALPQYPGSYQPPLYTVFLAAVLGVSGHSATAVKLAQILLSTLTAGLVFLLGTAWLGPRRGLVAGTLCALYPTLIAFSHYLWSETLFVFLLTLAFWLVTRTRELPTWGEALAAGLVLGLGILTRGMLLLFVPVIVAWLAWIHRERGRDAFVRAAAVALVAAAVVLPWTVRSSTMHGGLVVVDTNGSFNVWRGNTPDAYSDRSDPVGGTYARPFDGLPLMPVARQNQRRLVETVRQETGEDRPTDLTVARTASRLARADVLSAPGTFLARIPTKLVDLWNPTSFLLRHFRIGAYPGASPGVEAAVSWAAILSYLGVAGFGIAGAFLLRGDPRIRLVLLLILFVTALHGATFGLTRFRLPVMPFAMLMAAHAIVLAFDRGRARPGPPVG